MRKPKTERLLTGIVTTSLALATLSGCGVNRHELISVPSYPEEEVIVEDVNALPSPQESDCDTWTWDEEAEGYQCAEQGSHRYGHYYHGGSWFPTAAAFIAGRATAGNRGGNAGVTNRPGSPGNPQVTQPRTSTSNNPGTVAPSPRSGMGSGGSYGG